MENNTASAKKDVILSNKGNKEALYYLCLFSAAFLAAIALMIYALVKKNEGLTIYSYVLVPAFLVAALASLRYFIASIDPIFIKDGKLYVKKFLFTRRISTDSIEKITVATFGEDHKTSLKIAYGDKNAKYQFSNMDKDTQAKLRKLAK